MIRIRKAQADDLETIVDFNIDLADESEGVELDRERLRSGVQNALRDDRRAFYLIAESGGSVSGQLMVTFEWSDWRNAEFWWLQSVFVRPEFRRQGVLKALYARVLELAADQGVCGVRLYVEHSNLGAKSAYRSFGLEPTIFEMYEDDFVIDRGSHGPHSD